MIGEFQSGTVAQASPGTCKVMYEGHKLTEAGGIENARYRCNSLRQTSPTVLAWRWRWRRRRRRHPRHQEAARHRHGLSRPYCGDATVRHALFGYSTDSLMGNKFTPRPAEYISLTYASVLRGLGVDVSTFVHHCCAKTHANIYIVQREGCSWWQQRATWCQLVAFERHKAFPPV